MGATWRNLILMLTWLTWAPFVAVATAAVPGKLFIEDQATLTRLDQLTGGFAKLAVGAASPKQSTHELTQVKAYTDLATMLRQDIAVERLRMEALVPTAQREHLSIFPLSWLDSPAATFELVGVVLRPDRAVPLVSSCGELRLVYRLRYDLKTSASRLPMTAMLVYYLPRLDAANTGCHPQWQSWIKLVGGASHDSQSAAGLAVALRHLPHLDRLEINAQISRLAQINANAVLEQGHYLLRIFVPNAQGGLDPEPLENVPDTGRLIASPQLRRELLSWLQDAANLVALDRGSLMVPRRFLASKALSVAPYGDHRLVNQPYSQIFRESDFAAVALSSLALVKSPAAVLRRLDGLSCQGCHQSRSVAGFHFLGQGSGRAVSTYNALRSGYSNHFQELQNWRQQVATFGPEKAPAMPFPDHGAAVAGRGGHCALSDDKAFSNWSCQSDLRCSGSFPSFSSGQITGVCEDAAFAGKVGQACDAGQIDTSSESMLDYRTTEKILDCGKDGLCATGNNGFPNGICFKTCKLGDAYTGAVCTPGPLLKTFTPCMKAGSSFEECMSKHSAPALFPACNPTQPCRDDFACARVAGAVLGACMPPYTLPQLTIQFHPQI